MSSVESFLLPQRKPFHCLICLLSPDLFWLVQGVHLDFHTTTALFRWIGEWSCFVFGQAIAVFLKSTTTLVNLDLSHNILLKEGAEA